MFEKNNASSRKFKPLKIVFFIAVFVVIFTVVAWVVMLLWNAILPDVAGVKPLNFWKAAGLLVLAKILFGGFGSRGFRSRHSRRKQWRNKWMEMNPEERQEAKLRWKEYCNRKKSAGNKE